MKINRPDLAAYALVALVVLAVTTLAVLHVSIPDLLPYIAVGALGVGGGVAMQGSVTSSTSPTASPGPSAPAQAPQALLSEPATGVIPRVASHAP